VKIAFLFPSEGSLPGGGNKVVYEYANALTARGHQVRVIHFASAQPDRYARTRRGLMHVFRYIPLVLRGKWRPNSWFTLDPAVQLDFLPTPIEVLMPEADAYVATWWTTAERLSKMKRVQGKRFYLIQHLETWAGGEDVLATWRAPFVKIVIARWLEKIAEEMGEACHYIPNGLDFDRFGCDVPAEDRKPDRVAMVVNEKVAWKGYEDGVAALELLRSRRPDLEVELFGIHERPESLPEWLGYRQNPPQADIRKIYNWAGVFLAPSHSEGWGLPPCEAMMCGAAVVATDIDGHREFCVEGENALLVPAKDPEALASAAERLMNDSDLRIRLAKAGNLHVQRFTWKAATDALEAVFVAGGR
jgi:glycosyltransferase involved in cell wall biosynthesis